MGLLSHRFDSEVRAPRGVVLIATICAVVLGVVATGETAFAAIQVKGPGFLNGISADSATDVWAVGTFRNSAKAYQTLTWHWDGAAWTQVASPSPGGTTTSGDFSALNAVSSLSSTDAWAVGYDETPTTHTVADTLILHWDGVSWTQAASPNPGAESNLLRGVSADSASDAWAVGQYTLENSWGPSIEPLTLHWDGASWTQVASPSFGYIARLTAVTALSPTDAWAVGYYTSGSTLAQQTLVLHWDGISWSRVKCPNPGVKTSDTAPALTGVSAVSSTDAWAVGYFESLGAGATKTLLLHWDGISWSRVTSPNPGGGSSGADRSVLNGVSADSPSDAWAVGSYDRPETGSGNSLLLHWNGIAWTQVASPNPPTSGVLMAVSAESPGDAWAAGSSVPNIVAHVLVAYWNGTSWTQS